MGDVVYQEESYKIQGAVFEVYKELGCGFLENIYQEALAKEFLFRKIDFDEQKEINVFYKGDRLKQIYRPDFICYNKIIIELKAVSSLFIAIMPLCFI